MKMRNLLQDANARGDVNKHMVVSRECCKDEVNTLDHTQLQLDTVVEDPKDL